MFISCFKVDNPVILALGMRPLSPPPQKKNFEQEPRSFYSSKIGIRIFRDERVRTSAPNKVLLYIPYHFMKLIMMLSRRGLWVPSFFPFSAWHRERRLLHRAENLSFPFGKEPRMYIFWQLEHQDIVGLVQDLFLLRPTSRNSVQWELSTRCGVL